MKRMAEIEIAGKTYPLNFSMKIVRLVGERFGGVEKLLEAMNEMPDQDKINALFWLLEQLMEQGAAYKRLFENEQIDPLTIEHLETYFDVSNAGDLFETITESMSVSSETEVKTETAETDEKNAVTTQGR